MKLSQYISIILLGLVLTGCSGDIDNIKNENRLILTGYAGETSRTVFDTPEGYKIPYKWSAGDKIWLGNIQSNPLDMSCESATFVFDNVPPQPENHIFYNMTGTADEAVVPSVQTLSPDRNLGAMGDFGYAAAEADNSFSLEHKTSYVWFNTTTSLEGLRLTSIEISADGANLAGKATYDYSDGTFDNFTQTSSSVRVNLASAKLLSAQPDEQAEVVIVLFPQDLSSSQVRVVYSFDNGRSAMVLKQGRELKPGGVLRLSAVISELDPEIRVLTFEDSDYRGTGLMNSTGIASWSSLIDNPQYMGDLLYGSSGMGGPTELYYWADENNTMISHSLPLNWSSYCFTGGGHAISSYNASAYKTFGSYNYQLTVYNGAIQDNDMHTSGGGHNGSSNFCVHYGYHDNSGYSPDNVPSIAFYDGVPRVIDHMYVNNMVYSVKCFLEGNGLTPPLADDDYVKIVATGYDKNGNTRISEFYLALGLEFVTEWTKWDLSGLGAVLKVEFNLEGSSDNGYGYSQPAYFAYDDVAVRFSSM